jgi:hypothetical protein
MNEEESACTLYAVSQCSYIKILLKFPPNLHSYTEREKAQLARRKEKN